MNVIVISPVRMVAWMLVIYFWWARASTARIFAEYTFITATIGVFHTFYVTILFFIEKNISRIINIAHNFKNLVVLQ